MSTGTRRLRLMCYLLAGIVLVIAAACFYFGWQVTPWQEQFPYGLYLAYQQMARAFGLVLFPLSFLALMVWAALLIRAGRVQRVAVPGWTVVMLFAAGWIALVSSWAGTAHQLYPREAVQHNRHLFVLVAHQQASSENSSYLRLYECDSLGLLCQLRYSSTPYAPNRYGHDLHGLDAELVADRGALQLQIDGKTVYTAPAPA